MQTSTDHRSTTFSSGEALHMVATLQSELDALRIELEHIRRRDQTICDHLRRMDEEMRLAARVQKDFLPKSLPEVGPVRFATLYRPASYVSGDLFDVMRLTETHVGFFVADAVGHGVPAALLGMFVKNTLVSKEILADGYRLLSPGESLAKLNDALVGQNLDHPTFATAAYGHVDVSTLNLSVARAGHPHPVLIRDKEVIPLAAEGSLLGVFNGERFDTVETQLQRGDKVVIYTDGVEVLFGDSPNLDPQRWYDALQSRCDMTAGGMVDDFRDLLDSESGSLAPKDDLTLVVCEIT